MGLTAIDIMLYYTENKGGYFQRNGKKLVYHPSGNEPVKLFALSRSGYFTYSRPHNFKEKNIHKYEHNGYFFTREFIDKIRDNLGYPAHRDNSSINYSKQLDFDCHIFPVLILELQLCYYRILFGNEILNIMLDKTNVLVDNFSLDNPYKGACDDVFRDLRQIVVYAVDFGGITPTSYHHMLKDFYSIHNRAANGNCIELMEKIEALIEAGMIDVTYAKSNIQIDDNTVYLHSLSDPGNITTLETMIDAKLHNFDIKKSKNPLFTCLIDEGIASYWIHKDSYGVLNPISGFNISRNFQLINDKGIKEAVFCIGQPSEGVMFFQNGSIRPNVNHHVANDVLNCINAIKEEIINIKKNELC
ncbi:hypothetical protein [Xenorhabdus siamensis]|uniref:hypothetical protein n=1 Tax=Xenorhabdus siamensis TaxID=3136254 RepID=UPI0030F3FBAD